MSLPPRSTPTAPHSIAPGGAQLARPDARCQTALVRTLIDELKRAAPFSGTAEAIHEQLVDEWGKLGSGPADQGREELLASLEGIDLRTSGGRGAPRTT